MPIAALDRLDPRDRELLRLTAWEELSPRQAATVLGLSAVAARSRLHRDGVYRPRASRAASEQPADNR
ncbi:MAG: Sigma-70, region 4 [Solirubrobacterales bacterium]|jgi:RNA polymerase sigma-70 factor (ECF subfamily)|nr:Sigma-70, region 4 [Solirubrobacterales bacterium]